jgi:hydroxymethylpyrimidine/phosphomethylpyrimidine kinase
VKQLLIISGLDPSGGAGFLADARVAAELKARAVGVITATTTQDTQGVRAVDPISPETIEEELACLLADVEVGAVKIGMLGHPRTAAVVARALEGTRAPIVWDPVLRPTRGDVELTAGDLRPLLSKVALVTPNLAEASVLAGFPVVTADDMHRAAAHAIPVANILIKGGHLDGDPTDYLGLGETIMPIPGERIPAGATHGTGCVLSTAIACGLVHGGTLFDAVVAAKRFVEDKLREAFVVGRGARCLV